MNVNANILKWALRMYPPLLLQRIWVVRFAKDFTSVEVKINKSLFNKNYNGTIFGGTIFSAGDPFFAVLFDQVFKKRGYKTIAWLKSAHIQYLKPGDTDLFFKIEITDKDISEAQIAMDSIGKFVKTYQIDIKNKRGELCAVIQNEVYIRNLGKHQNAVRG